MSPRSAGSLLALLTVALLAAGCAERAESVDQDRPYYEGGDTGAPPACPGADTRSGGAGPSDGEASEHECPSGDATSHPVEGEASG